VKKIPVILIWIIALAMIWPVFKPLVSKDSSSESLLGQVPVLEGGRIKPFDSVARSTLLLFLGKQSIRTEEGKIPAVTWLTDVIFNREAANAMPVFRIDHPNILGMFGMEPGSEKYFSYDDLKPYLSRIEEQARMVDSDSKNRNSYETAILRVFNNLIHYQMLTQTVYPLSIQDKVGTYYSTVAQSVLEVAGKFAGSNKSSPEEFVTTQLRFHMQQLENMSKTPLFLMNYNGNWETPGEVLRVSIPEIGGITGQLQNLGEMADARLAGNDEQFQQAVQQFAGYAPAIEDAKPATEYYFNQSQPFIVSLGLYVLVSLLVFLGWQFSSRIFLPTAYNILLAGFAIHTAGLVLRVIITGYAPVTNLYSSAVFVGWVAILLSVVFESFQKRGVGTLAAATVGFLTLLIAHHLSDSGDTMEKMRAVLNSNFWLSTHVITITMGYGATFLAGFLGLIYVLYGWFRRGLDKEMHKSFHRMIYGAVCFALLFSFVGTVLGGIWADQSWGRFWGWDPKENGALMIVIWTAMILHALRCGMIKTRGLVLLSIGGNIVTAWSWFGTNMLGVGLHAYGFMDSAFFWLVMFWLSQLIMIGFEGLFPVRVRKE